MKTILLSLLAGFILCYSVRGQDFGFEMGAGLHDPKMEDLIVLQEYLQDFGQFESRTMSSFPAYVTASIGIRKKLYPSVQAGGSYSYSSSGARSNYSDYSGSLSTDFNTESHRIGAMVSYRVLGEQRLVLSAYGKAELNYSLTRITRTVYALFSNEFGTFEHSDGAIYKFRTISPSLSGGLEIYYHLEASSFGIDAGYFADIPGSLKDRDTGDAIMDPRDRNRELTVDWTGWRLQLKVIIWL